MPKRPRSHRLEEESRRKFRESIPSQWVIRNSDPDYGIDEQVEVFDESGSATGILFLVQLKGTDSPNLRDALSVRLPIETLRYYRSLDLPVMIVSYHTTTNTLFWRWTHEFAECRDQRTKKTLTFSIPKENRWTAETPQRVSSDLETFRRLKSSELSLPIEFELKFDEASINGTPVILIESALQEALKPLSSLIGLTSTIPLGAHPTLTVGSKTLVANLAGLSSVRIRLTQGYSSGEVTAVLPHDLLFVAAVLFDRYGHADIAAQIFSKCLYKSRFRFSPIMFFSAMGVFVRADRISDALSLSERFLEDAQEGFLAEMSLIPVLVADKPLNSAEEQFYLHLRRLIIERCEKAGYIIAAAAAHYNLGNHLRSKGRTHSKAAFKHYRLAARKDPGYRKRPYFWQDLGGVLFNLERFLFAATAYDQAIKLGTKHPMARALKADSLMFAGKYRDALACFEDYFEREPKPEDEWYLKRFALEFLINSLGMEKQKREPDRASSLADIETLPAGRRKHQLLEALKADALSPLAWINLGGEYHRSQLPEDALFAFLLAALINIYDPEAWTNSISLALGMKKYWGLLQAIMAHAHSIHGDEILQTLNRRMQQQTDDKRKGELLENFQQCFRFLETLQTPKPGPVLRLYDKDDEYQVIDLIKPTEDTEKQE